MAQSVKRRLSGSGDQAVVASNLGRGLTVCQTPLSGQGFYHVMGRGTELYRPGLQTQTGHSSDGLVRNTAMTSANVEAVGIN